MRQPTGCTGQESKQYIAVLCQGSAFFWRMSLRLHDPDDEPGANGAMSAEKVHGVTEEFESMSQI